MKRPIAPLVILCLLLLSVYGSSDMSSRGLALQGLTGSSSTIACPPNRVVDPASNSNEKVTLKVIGWASTPAEDALVRANLDLFNSIHPSIYAEWSPIPSSEDFPARMRANFESGNAPDVFYLRPDMAYEYISSGTLLNLSPYMARDNVKASAYYPALIAPFSCKNGQIYGIPKDWNTLGIFYNKRLFREAGVPFPSENWTWDDMRRIARQLTNEQAGSPERSIYGITLPVDSSRWLAFLFASGGSVLNREGTHAIFNSQEGVDSLNFYTSFQLKDRSSVLPSHLVPAGAEEVFDAFGKERAAMVLEGGWLIPYLAQQEREKKFQHIDYGIAPLPINSETGRRANLIYTNSWSAYSETRFPDAAWELIKFMTGEQAQRSVLQAGFALPSLASLANDPYFVSNPSIKVLFNAATYGYADQFGPQDPLIHQRLNQAIASVLFGDADAKAALDDAARQIDRVLQQVITSTQQAILAEPPLRDIGHPP